VPVHPVPLPHLIGRYALYGEIASGGMATVHYGRLLGPVGFARTVAIKRLHAQFAKDPEFVSMFLDEARLAARVRHPNVVQTLDVVALEGELFLVMDYVQGEALSRLVSAVRAKQENIPVEIVSSIVCGALHGLNAAHEATNERGEPLHIVHRDVSPHNVVAGVDGIARVLDFGVAKAAGRMHTTREGQLKGKLAYMAPEQVTSAPLDRRTDVFATGIVLWEALTSQRLFAADHEGATVANVLSMPIPAPSTLVGDLPRGVDEVVLRALERDRSKRFDSARDMALELEARVPLASPTRVAAWVEQLAHEALVKRARAIAEIESDSGGMLRPSPSAPDHGPSEPTTGARESAGEHTTPDATLSASTTRVMPERIAPTLSKRAKIYVMGGLGAAVLAISPVFLRGERRTSPPIERAQSAVAQPSPEPAPSVLPAPTPPVVPRAEPTSDLTTLAEPAPPASGSAAAPRAHPPGALPIAPRPTARPLPGPTPASSSTAEKSKPCAVRSYIDDVGIKHFVQECK
jgi:serine/threonine-protein kinase